MSGRSCDRPSTVRRRPLPTLGTIPRWTCKVAARPPRASRPPFSAPMLLRDEPPSRPPDESALVGPARFRVAEADGADPTLRLRGELDLAAVTTLREHVHRVASRDGTAILDLSGVVFIDGAGLAALSALVREARLARWHLDLRHPSLAIRELARLTCTQGVWNSA
jgi:anti-anti-sigma factor